ncbi:hypothetical protein [Kitasatospora sp. NPDC048538]|uniref:hypothetical protein n=1 Tax=unclassified Kitasatospora TaxID=2633591 RepID=UPI0033E7B3BA
MLLVRVAVCRGVSKTSVSNETEGMHCLWVEPRGTDHRMRPGEEFTVVTEPEHEKSPSDVVVHAQGITVWVNSSNHAEVVDKNGGIVPCGHQRPADCDDSADEKLSFDAVQGRHCSRKSGCSA